MDDEDFQATAFSVLAKAIWEAANARPEIGSPTN